MKRIGQESTVAGRQFLYNTSIRIIGLIIGFVTELIFARKLGKDAYGLFALALSVISVMGIFSISGFPKALVRIIGAHGIRDNYCTASFLKLSILWVISISLLSAIFIILGKEILSNYIFKEPRLITLSLPTAIQLFIFSICSLWLGVFEGVQLSSIGYSIREIIGRLLKLMFFFVVGFWFGFNANTLMWGYCLGQLFSLILYVTLAEKIGGSIFNLIKIIKSRLPDAKGQKRFLAFSWSLSSKAFIGLLMAHAGRLMLAYYTNTGEIGLYSVSMNLGNLLLLGLGAINIVLLPIVARLHRERDYTRLSLYCKASFNVATAFSIPLFSLFLLFPEELLLLYGKEFLNAKISLIYISGAFFINSIIGTNYPFLIMSKKYNIEIIITLCAGIINIIIGFIMIPKIGIVGAAYAFFFAKISMSLLRGVVLYKKFKLNPLTKKNWRFVALVPIIYFLKDILEIYGMNIIAIMLIFLFVTYCVSGIIYYSLVISDSEKKVMRNIFKSFKILKIYNKDY